MDQRKSFPMKKLQSDVGHWKQNSIKIFIFLCLVSQIDLERIESTFRDITNGTNELSYTSFKRDVFANFIPEKLANVRILFNCKYLNWDVSQ